MSYRLKTEYKSGFKNTLLILILYLKNLNALRFSKLVVLFFAKVIRNTINMLRKMVLTKRYTTHEISPHFLLVNSPHP